MSKCNECGGQVEQSIGTYLYDAEGLKVTLQEVPVTRCDGCGGTGVVIRGIAKLNRAIASAIIREPGRLLPAEVKFLRKSLGWSGNDLALNLGVDAATVSRWENGHDPIGPQADRLIRAMVVLESPIPDYAAHNLRNVTKAKREPAPMRFARSKSKSWGIVA